ncbi:HAD family hydrolase [Carnobacterium gallinarum]|uniref:HAD family hydrolase n=1 Tax=Carnobacterium gallinarum TaxID=2749 RepID=UPI00055134FA|nr:HAD family phosphatase [Carnobacterium gallinarum]
MSEVKAVIFDMDGLIFDTETLYYRSSQEVADRLGLAFDYEYYTRFIGVSDEELHENLYRDFKDDDKVARLISESRTRLDEMVAEDGLIIKEGFLELLDFLEENQIKKVVASSNVEELVRYFLERENLHHRFDYFVSGDDVKRAKPDPEIFEKAWSDLGVAKNETLILEDSINGIRAAHDAGIEVIMIPDLIPPTSEAELKTVAIYEDLSHVKKYIDTKNN